MRIKIKTPGWETFSDVLGMTKFENGVSAEEISSREAYSLGSFLDVVELNPDGTEGNPVSQSFDLVRQQTISAPVMQPRRRLSEIQAEEEANRVAAGEDPKPTPNVWTLEALEKVASEKGIAGIREIADPLGIKGTAIKTMIAEILLKQPK